MTIGERLSLGRISLTLLFCPLSQNCFSGTLRPLHRTEFGGPVLPAFRAAHFGRACTSIPQCSEHVNTGQNQQCARCKASSPIMQSLLVKPINTHDLLRQIEALLIAHQDRKGAAAASGPASCLLSPFSLVTLNRVLK